ncbi:hypothetical protein FKM82_003989 [Ascaphus truei]
MTSAVGAAPHNQTMNCSNSLMGRNRSLDHFQLILFVPIVAFGTIFNSFAVWVFCFKMKKWTEARVYMMNLLISDCCLLFVMPFRIYSSLRDWELGDNLCNSIRSFYFMNTYMSIAIITLISVDRYVAIKFPLRSRTLRSPQRAAMACGSVWVLLIATRFYLHFVAIVPPLTKFCFRKTSTNPLRRTLYFAILGFFLPMAILIFCSVEIIRTLKRKDSPSVNEQKCVQKTIYIVSTNLVIFLVCFLPLSIGNVVRFVVESLGLECSVIANINTYVYAAQAISDLNCCFDAICYYFVANEFWETSSLLKKSTLPQLSQERTQVSIL